MSLMRRSIFDDLFDSSLTGSGRFHPALDISERDEEYVVRLDVPGVKAGDLSVEVRDNLLTVRGHREWNADESARGLSHLERGYGTFERTIALPSGVGDPVADLTDGVLTLRIAKPIEAQPKRIEIETGDKPETIEAGA
jgi:HSP20 family protein